LVLASVLDKNRLARRPAAFTVSKEVIATATATMLRMTFNLVMVKGVLGLV
ncbi:hypothetical protein BBI17_007741, partial [Phytophthora kernoviae]